MMPFPLLKAKQAEDVFPEATRKQSTLYAPCKHVYTAGCIDHRQMRAGHSEA